jgi:arsenate reductase
VLPKLNLLFLCTGNSCRSQMAEGWTRHLQPRIEPYSAGVAPGRLDPRAVQVMAECGVDISRQQPKHVDTLAAIRFDRVVTVCSNAREQCPVFPADVPVDHVGFDDPPALARDARTDEQALEHYRRVRDEIRIFVSGLGDHLEGQDQGVQA